MANIRLKKSSALSTSMVIRPGMEKIETFLNGFMLCALIVFAFLRTVEHFSRRWTIRGC